MAKQYDVTFKHLFDAHPADWLALANLPSASRLEVIDADLSMLNLAVDKAIRVMGNNPYVAHFECQSRAEADFDRRMLLYNVLLRWRERLPVCSTAILLRAEALSPSMTGLFRESSHDDNLLEFRYQTIRLWEQSPEALLAGGIGTVPLAPVARASLDEVPGIVKRMENRFIRELSPAEAQESWLATFVLLGLRYPKDIVQQLLTGVRQMRESTTYQWIIEQGLQEGRQQGIQQGMQQGRAEGEARGQLREARGLLLRLGTRQFGAPPPAEALTGIDQLSDVAEIESLVERVLVAASWNDLFPAKA